MTHRQSRRQFIGLMAAGAASLSRWQILNAAAAQEFSPDLVVLNAKVYTMEGSTPRVQAFAIKAGRFVAVGTTDEIKGLGGKSTQTTDAKQMTIVPGFTDCHNHAPGNTLLYE